jgi:hypothetical protein
MLIPISRQIVVETTPIQTTTTITITIRDKSFRPFPSHPLISINTNTKIFHNHHMDPTHTLTRTRIPKRKNMDQIQHSSHKLSCYPSLSLPYGPRKT